MSKYKHPIPKHLERALDDLEEKYPFKEDYDKALKSAIDEATDNIMERMFRDEDMKEKREENESISGQ